MHSLRLQTVVLVCWRGAKAWKFVKKMFFLQTFIDFIAQTF